MFEAYKIGIRLSLINQVSGTLGAISRHFRAADRDAAVLQRRLHSIKLLGLAGAAMGGAGFLGLGLIAKAIKPAEDYAHQVNKLNMLGMTHKEIAQSIGTAWKNTGTVITTTVNDNLRALIDLRSVLGNMGHAVAALPIITKIQAVLGASTDERVSGNARNFAFDIAKAADIAGKASNPAVFTNFAERMAQVIIATQGRVTPSAYQQVIKYARQARYSLSDDFLFKYLPTLILENASTSGGGGGSRGVGPMLAAMFRISNQGYINKKSLPMLQSLGLVEGTALSTTTSGTTIDALRNHALAGSNPFLWTQQVLMPAIYKKFGHNLSREKLSFIIGQIFRGNQLGSSAFAEFAVKPYNFERDARLIGRVMPLNAAYQMALSNDPATARHALGAQWENFKTALTMSVVPVLVPALMHVTHWLNSLAGVMRRNQGLVKPLVFSLIGLSGALAITGPILVLTAGFKSLSLAMSLLGGAAIKSAVLNISGLAAGLGKVGLVGGAGAAGYAAGKYGLNPLLNWATGGSFGAWIYNESHPHEDLGLTPTWVGSVGHHTHVYLDGRKIAEVVTKHQAAAANRPPAAASFYDSILGDYIPRMVSQ